MAVNQIKAGVVLNYVTIGLNTLVGLLYTPYMLRMLGQNEYGLYSLVASVIAYLTVLDFGFGNAIIRYTAKFRAEGKQDEQYSMFGMFLILYSVIGLLVFAIGSALYFNVDRLFGDTMSPTDLDQARVLIIILLINLAFTFPLSIFGSIITAYENFVFKKVLQIVRVVLNTTVMIVILHFGYKAIGLAVVQTIFNLSSLLVDLFYCKYKIKIKIKFGRFRWGFLKEVAIYSFWIFLNVIMDKIYWGTGQFVLGSISGTIAVAIFSVAIQLESMYMTFSTAVSSVFLPRVTAMVANNRSNTEISNLFIRTGRIQHIVMAFILSGFIVFGRQFVAIWAGRGYDEVYAVTLMFFVALFIPLIQNLGVTILQARNQMKFRSLLYLAISLTSLGLQIVGTKLFGVYGCAIAVAGALIVGQGLVMNIYYHKVQRINIVKFWKEIGKMSIVPILFVIIGLLLIKADTCNQPLSLIVGIVIYSTLYLPVFWNFSMNDEERQLVCSPLLKVKLKLLHK